MHTIRRLVAVAAVLAFVAVPAAQAQSTLNNPSVSTDTTLYFHIFDTFNKFVINTQPMDADFFEVGGTSFPTVSGTPANNEEVGDYNLNTIYGTSTAGPVEYDFIENGKPRFHPEPGIAQDVLIDGSVDPVVYLYLDVRDFFSSGSVTGMGAPNVLPSYTFRVQMREGDDPGVDADLDSGDPILHGETTVHIVDGQAVPINDLVAMFPEADHPFVTADASGIVEIAVPLTIDQEFIPKTEAFNVRLDWYQFGDVQEDAFAEGYLRLFADPDHLPRLEFAITNPVYIEFIHPQVAAGLLLIHTGVNSPWGTYDVDVNNITIKVEGPSTPDTLDRVIAQNIHVHGLHDQAAEVTYLWKFRDEGAKEGEYTITYSVQNAAHTATATGTAGFVVEGKKAFGISDTGDVVEPTVEEESKDSPALGPLAGLAVLGAAFLSRRRSG